MYLENLRFSIVFGAFFCYNRCKNEKKEGDAVFRTHVGFRDLIAAVAVVALAVLLLCLPLFFAEEGRILVISTPDGNAEYDLSVPQEIRIASRGIELVIVIENGTARVASSTCPDGICLVGTLSRGGDTVICAPAGVRLLVKGGDGDVDFVAG